MKNNEIVKEWFRFADMDLQTAQYLHVNMCPKPLEIICYHCQQAVEKMLKGLLLSYGTVAQRTHDLGLMAEELSEFIEVSEEKISMCDELTPYGVKIRYPQELFIEENHAQKALENATDLCKWIEGLAK